MKIKWLLPCWFLACSLFPPLSSFGEEITGFPDMMFYRYRIHRSIRYLYPEVDIYQFPAVISRVDKTLYAPGVNIRWEREAHLENNGGTGFRQETNQEVDSGLNLIGIHPLSEAWTLGYMVSGGEKWRQTRKDYQDWDWNSNGYLEDQEEDFEARHGALDWSTTDIGFLSWEGERLSLGGSLGGRFSDEALNRQFETYESDALEGTAYKDGPGAVRTADTEYHGWTNGGLWYRGDRLEAGATLSAGMGVTTQQVTALEDTTGDGWSDTLVPMKDYRGWDHYEPRFFTPHLELHGTVMADLNPGLTLIFMAESGLIDFTLETLVYGAGHVASQYRDQNLKDHDLMVGMRLQPASSLAVRAGVGYGYMGETASVKDSGGLYLIAEDNTAGYCEVDWGGQPGNQDVIHAVRSSEGWRPDETKHSVYGAAGVEWAPHWRVSLFSMAKAYWEKSTRTFRVYDRLTDRVWKETEGSGYFDLDLMTLAGAAVKIRSDLTVSMTFNNIRLDGNWYQDRLPENSLGAFETPVNHSWHELDLAVNVIWQQ